jgi:hypothetical protein
MSIAGNPLLWMVIGHCVADFPLQGDWLSKAKNPTLYPVPGEVIWPHAMFAHCMIHAGAVLLATGSMKLAFAEYLAHFAIDYWKCKGGLTYNADQWEHIMCKFVWFAALGFMT